MTRSPSPASPCYLYPPAAATIANLLAAPEKFARQPLPAAAIANQAELKPMGNAQQSPVMLPGGIAVIHARGLLMREFGMLARFGLATSTVMLCEDMQALQRNDKVRSIILLCDSPGGLAMGTEECAAALDSITAGPSTLIGSIGTVAVHLDYSEALKQAGIVAELIHFGARKVDGTPYQPLSAASRAALQERIDAYGNQFVASVARHRNITAAEVRTRYGDGKVYIGTEAVTRGLADSLGTLSGVLEASGGRDGPQNAATSLSFQLNHRDQEMLARASLVPRNRIGRLSQAECADAIADYCRQTGRPLPARPLDLERAIRKDFPAVAGWLSL